MRTGSGKSWFQWAAPPHKFRPETSEEDWEDNYISNGMAWCASQLGLCKREQQRSSRLADYFWVQCACCLFFRGLSLGVILGLAAGFLIGSLL